MQVCSAVEEFDDSLRKLAEKMLEIMYASNGVGLAAPQVGVPVRLFVGNPQAQPGSEAEGIYVNPEILERSGSQTDEEGCLSFPGISCNVKRAMYATIRAQDLNGKIFTQKGEGLTARMFQHETDHLDGILLSDKMSTVAKIANRWLLKELTEDYKAGR
jgi:peptide deformylase